MKFLMLYTSKPGAPEPTPEHIARINAYTERQVQAGVVKMGGGIVRPTRGIKLSCEGGRVAVTDGPFAETKELIDGFALVEAASHEEAVALATEFMQLAGDGTGEILRVFEGEGEP